MKSTFQTVFVIFAAGLLTFAASRAWHQIQNQHQEIETLTHSVESLQILKETPPTIIPKEEEAHAPTFSLFDAIKENPSVNEATSPDGEWVAAIRVLNRSPFARNRTFWLELLNQRGGSNRLIYLSWFENPQSTHLDPQPIGWSPDGRSIYISYDTRSEKNQPRTSSHGFSYAGNAFRINLDDKIAHASDRITPYTGNESDDRTGNLLDILPTRNIGIWFDEPTDRETGKGPSINTQKQEARLLSFDLDGSSPYNVLTTFKSDEQIRITSAGMSHDATDLFYVTHKNKKNNEVFYLTLGSNSLPRQVDLTHFTPQLRKQGITTPYTIEIEKTQLTSKDDLTLIFTGANGKRITNRWMNIGGRTSLRED